MVGVFFRNAFLSAIGSGFPRPNNKRNECGNMLGLFVFLSRVRIDLMTRGIVMLLLATLILALPNSIVVGQELLRDPGFEATDVDAQTNPFWTLDVNLPGDGAEPAARYQAAPWASNPTGTPGIGIWNRAFDGTPENPAEARIYQDVTGVPGTEYTLTAYYKAETFYTSAATAVGIEFLQGGTVVGSSNVDLNTAAAPYDGAWNQYTVMATAPVGTETVRVFGLMVQGVVGAGNPQSSMFDDFSLTAVPEPSTGVLAALLFGCMAFVVHRRSARC
jgi:hypothetical protein